MQKHIQLFLAFTLLGTFSAYAGEQRHDFIVDRYFSPYASSPTIISVRGLLNNLQGGDLAFQKSSARFCGRCGSTILNNALNDFLMLASHEVHGHGFRMRSFGYNVDGYSLSILFPPALLFLPMNSFGGATHFAYAQNLPSGDADLMVTIAGNEANSILANEIIIKNFTIGYLGPKSYNLFFKAFTNLLGYLVVTSEENAGDDIQAYLKTINYKYRYQQKTSLRDLRLSSLVFWLNPILYTSIYSFYAYLFAGKQHVAIPQLNFNNIHYMPVVRMGLTPFGVNYYVDNYISLGQRTFLLGINAGKSPFYSNVYSGANFRTQNLLIYQRYGLDITGNVWHQPALYFDNYDAIKDKNHLGGLLGITNTFNIAKNFGINLSLFYKSQGFIEGEVAQQGFIVRGGLSLVY